MFLSFVEIVALNCGPGHTTTEASPKAKGPGPPACPASALRFGEALAAVRSDTMDQRQREARKFLALAQKSENEMDVRARPNNILIRGADLKPVVDFLSGCQKMSFQ